MVYRIKHDRRDKLRRDYQEEEKTEKDSDSQQEVAAGNQGNAEQKLTGRYSEKQIVKDLTSDGATDERNPEQIFVETAMTAKAAMDRLAETKVQTKGEQWNELEKLGIIRRDVPMDNPHIFVIEVLRWHLMAMGRATLPLWEMPAWKSNFPVTDRGNICLYLFARQNPTKEEKGDFKVAEVLEMVMHYITKDSLWKQHRFMECKEKYMLSVPMDNLLKHAKDYERKHSKALACILRYNNQDPLP